MKLNDSISGKTKLLGLLGNPVEHTVSPLLHNSLSNLLKLDTVYIPLKVEKGMLGEMVKGLKAGNFTGFNATIPFKEELLKYVDNITDEVRLTGSANTVKNIKGTLYAYNTDADGFVRAFYNETGETFQDKSITFLGAGGTARSLAVKAAAKGASRLHIINRTQKKAEEIAETIRQNYSTVCLTADFSDNAEIQKIVGDSEIIINTTSVGLHPNTEESPVTDDIILKAGQTVYDVIYNPAKTKLLRQAEAAGCKIANGLGMLFYQGILAYEIWMDLKIPEEILNKLYAEFSKYLNK